MDQGTTENLFLIVMVGFSYASLDSMVKVGCSFFMKGQDCEPGYRNVRESAFLRPAREYTEKLWRLYAPYADCHFRQDARRHFLQRYWEMYVTAALMEYGHEPYRVGGTGPEYFFLFDECRAWVEAIAPGPGEENDRVPDNLADLGFRVPTEKILLRYTSALRAKRDKLLQDQRKGIVSTDDAYILALNCRNIHHAWFGGVIPYVLQAYLPFGPLSMMLDLSSGKAIGRSFERRKSVSKQSGASVATTAFLDPAYSGISAVIHSSVNAANAPVVIGEDFLVLHNPLARRPLGLKLFSQWRQYIFADDQVRVIEPDKALYRKRKQRGVNGVERGQRGQISTIIKAFLKMLRPEPFTRTNHFQ